MKASTAVLARMDAAGVYSFGGFNTAELTKLAAKSLRMLAQQRIRPLSQPVDLPYAAGGSGSGAARGAHDLCGTRIRYPFAEASVPKVAEAYQQETDWHTPRPPVLAKGMDRSE
ncbi:hypothetical protein KIP88_42565 [Bradyrhizobium sp. SRL28]|uniref:hypothetical protein n=1 Tax=Bradyrhizobium sp. SRL28 TaxID=2836178 RepID=UPI001BDDFC68|nr:hypothetical protein [Bradyrhizobium sp. SRL28]MBT1517055.1 hypothetical protein [Bradyrhizobium sp. SRL28]